MPGSKHVPPHRHKYLPTSVKGSAVIPGSEKCTVSPIQISLHERKRIMLASEIYVQSHRQK